jgi:hypothetical protein
MFNRFKSYLIYILLVCIVALFFYIRIQQNINQRQVDEVYRLDEQLLKMDTIVRNMRTSYTRGKDGKIIIKREYIPQEAKVIIKVDKETNNVTTTIRRYGFCYSHGVSASYDYSAKGISFAYSPKIFFWGRYGSIINISGQSLGVGISRNISDTPLLHLLNTEIFVSYQGIKFYTDAPTYHVGFRWII